MLLNAILFSYQLSTLKGSFFYGLKYMLYCFLKRSHGNSSDFPEGFKASLESNVFDVLRTYLNAHGISIGRQSFHFNTIIIIFIIFSLISIFSKKISPTNYKYRSKNIALIITTWVSILAPLSWFIVFQAHSYIHTTFDEIVWYMPFTLFGTALIGSVSSALVKDINAYLENRPQNSL
jgi:Na+/H+-translocating membrane pyrophosphatase